MRYFGSIAHNRPRGDGCFAADNDVVHHNGPVTDEDVIFDSAAFEVHLVTDDAAVANDGGLVACGVNDGAVLDRGALTNANGAVVATKHCGRPHAAVGPNVHVTNDDGIGVNEGQWIDRGFAIS